MPKSKIKKEFGDQHVAFGKGGRGLKLGQRTDIDKLAIIALQSGNRHLLDMFEQPMPSLDELLKDETDAQLKTKPATTTAPVKPAPTAPATTTTTTAPAPPPPPPATPEQPK
jgi:hypothetical protein